MQSRLEQHFEIREKGSTFASKFDCYKLIYFEIYLNIKMAIDRKNENIDMSGRENRINKNY